LTKLGKTLPYDATFQGVAVLSSTYDSQLKNTKDNVLLTTGRFHTIQLEIIYDAKASIVSKKVIRFYLRYSYYEVMNHISHQNGLFLVKHVLPNEYNNGNQTQQLFTVYNTRGDFNGTADDKGLIGAFPVKDNITHNFDFNLTYDAADQHLEPRVGVTIV
jgi:hypothetical protein